MISTNIKIYIQPTSEDYAYETEASKDGELMLKYFESGKLHSYISFGNLEEMEYVANAMLKVIKLSKE